jgi:5-(carboxyamino)imidazole ribonucleotide synthase
MLNLLGDVWVENDNDPDWRAVLAHRGTSLHLYGKHQARRGRKMGHITFTAPTLEEALSNQNQVRKQLGMPDLES